MSKRKGKRSYNYNYSKYYSGTSEARDLNTINAYKPPSLQTAVVNRTEASSAKTGGVCYRNVGQTRAKFSPYTVATIIVIFACAVLLMVGYALITSRQMELAYYTNELRQIREQNSVLEMQIARSYDVAEIERIATTRLGLGQPQPHQTVHFSTPRQSYAVRTDLVDAETPVHEESIFDRLMHIIAGD